jgi:hypothetical protein
MCYLRLSSSISNFCCAFSLNLHVKIFRLHYIFTYTYISWVWVSAFQYRFEFIIEINSSFISYGGNFSKVSRHVLASTIFVTDLRLKFTYFVLLVYDENCAVR